MFRPRVIPVLLLRNLALVKSVKFKDFRYIGDPINAVRIFNDSKADELVFLDIDATHENRLISLEFVRNVGEEANMPFAAGGGIKSLEEIRNILKAGAEKVVINSYAIRNPDFIRQASEAFGSSAIVVCIDVENKFLKKQSIKIPGAVKDFKYSPNEFSLLMQEKGAGELIIQSVDNDGVMKGYDIELVKQISQAVTIPVIALGGAGNLLHLKQVYEEGFATGLAAGSLFVFHGPHNGVLINYPDKKEMISLFASE